MLYVPFNLFVTVQQLLLLFIEKRKDLLRKFFLVLLYDYRFEEFCILYKRNHITVPHTIPTIILSVLL